MVKLNLTIDDEKKSYEVPDCWEDMTVKMYEKLTSVKESENDLKYSLDLICALVGMDIKTAYMIPVNDMPKILEPLEFAKTPIKLSKKKSITINKEKYYLKDDFDNLNTGEVISLNILKDKYQNNIEAGISEMLCIFLRKKKSNNKLETFDDEFMDRAEMFRENVRIMDVHSMFVFFLNGKKQ